MTTEPTARVPGHGVDVTPPRLLLLSGVLGYLGVLWLSLFHRVAGGREPHALATLAVRDGTLALPLVLAGVAGAVALSERMLRHVGDVDERLRRAVTTVLVAAGTAAALAVAGPV